VANFAYTQVAPEAGLEIPGAVAAWLDRVRALPGFTNDLQPYPDNARPEHGRSIYDVTA
jgi:hypothetical protein